MLLRAVDDGHTPLPEHMAQAGRQVNHKRRVLVEADNGDVVGQLPAQRFEAALTHIAAAGVEMGSTLSVVPVRDDR